MRRQIDAGGQASPTYAQISFSTSNRDADLIAQIAERAERMAAMHRHPRDRRKVMDYNMDITAAHANGCRLQLRQLLNADDFNFAHDVFGIERHLNRTTGALEDCFLPRFAARSQNILPGDHPLNKQHIRERRAARKAARRG